MIAPKAAAARIWGAIRGTIDPRMMTKSCQAGGL
jgi:hypothetical protein